MDYRKTPSCVTGKALRQIGALAIALGSSSLADATDYYVGSTAIQQGGTAVTDIVAVNALALKAGDRVLFAGGETFTGPLEISEDDGGTKAAPIVVTSYGNGRATIDGGTGNGIKIYNAGGIVLRNLNLVGSGRDTATGMGIQAVVYLPDSTKLEYLRFEQMEISGFKTGVEVFSWYSSSVVAWPGFRDVAMTNLVVHDNTRDGIRTAGVWRANSLAGKYSHEDFYIGNCETYNNKGEISLTSFSGSGINVAAVDRAVVEYCVAHDNGGNGPTTGGGPYGIWTWESRSVAIQYNIVYNQKSSSPLDGGAYDLDGGANHCVLQYNYSYNNEGPAIGIIQFNDASPLVNNVVRYNISENDCRKTTQGIIYVGEFSEPYGIDGVDIYGNTLFVSKNLRGNKPPLVTIMNQDDIKNVRIRNNLFVATHGGNLLSGALNQPAKALFQGNSYWGGILDLAAFRAGGQETLDGQPVGFRVDPQLTSPGGGGPITDPTLLPQMSAYVLRSTSPLIGAGLDLNARFYLNPGTTDFYGLPISSTDLDIGASSATIVPPVVTTPKDPEPAGPLVDDQFEGSGSLAGRRPDGVAPTGSAWKLLTGNAAVANGVVSTNGTLRAVIDAGIADGVVETTINFITADTGILVRNSDGSNYLRIVLFGNSLQLKKTEAAATTTLASKSATFVLGRTYKMRAVLSGPTITVSIDGTVMATFTTSFNLQATRFGLLTSNTGVRQWDRFTVTR